MTPGGHPFAKLLSPRVTARALITLDRSTSVVVGVCWLVAIVILIVSVLEVRSAVAAKQQAADAMVAEPVLPTPAATPLDAREAQQVVEKLQRQFPDIKVDVDASHALTIRADDGTKFHQWITALSYIDTMAPQYRWSLHEFCVGHCSSDLMKAVVTGQKVTFTLPSR